MPVIAIIATEGEIKGTEEKKQDAGGATVTHITDLTLPIGVYTALLYPKGALSKFTGL